MNDWPAGDYSSSSSSNSSSSSSISGGSTRRSINSCVKVIVAGDYCIVKKGECLSGAFTVVVILTAAPAAVVSAAS